jgi:hypothetical protein
LNIFLMRIDDDVNIVVAGVTAGSKILKNFSDGRTPHINSRSLDVSGPDT